ncbi:MAG TPA: hypothetical protein DER68_01745 [Ruminococcaceae bacterium]|nr:hypothetical protein [Oscillospiraceae bacterium]
MDISRMADISAVNQTNLTKTSERRTEMKSTTLTTEHTDSFVKSEAAYTPAYTKKSARKQGSDNNLTQKENAGEKELERITDGEKQAPEALLTKGVSHIIRAMFVKQGEVLSGSVPSVGAKMYAEELLSQLRLMYGNSAAEENTPEYWQPDETASRLMMFFDSVKIDSEDRNGLLERSFLSAFGDTEKLFGGRGRLPLESYETKQIIMESYFSGN